MTEQSRSRLRWRPRTFIERMGAALVDPRAALAAADEPDNAGRTATDAALLLVFGVVALHTLQIVVSVWVGVADGLGTGMQALVDLVGRSVGSDLVLIVVGGVGVTVVAGRRRSIGRDFDLACVAYVPFTLVQWVANLGFKLAGVQPTRAMTDVGGAIAFGWAGVIIVLAAVHARRRQVGDG